MRILLLLLLLFGFNFSFAQNRKDSVYTYVDKQAEPVGGLKEFYSYFSKNLIIPDSLKKEDMTNFSACYKNINFIVEKDGKLNFLSNPKCNVTIVNEIFKRVIENAPKMETSNL
jgi:hypothetical protein